MLNPLNQDINCKIFQTIKTVEWLVNKTEVRTFDKITFKGYQRQVNEKHVNNIVKYIEGRQFYLPTSIICASDDKLNEDTKLYIVDGQHRIEAFKKLKNNNREEYKKIKNYKVSVIVLENPSEALEIDTFITINKKSRKVDTSLALILQKKINRKIGSSDKLITAKKEYLAVELAILLNSERNSIWNNKILLEGNPNKYTYESISLNSFVRSTRVFISYLEKYKIISINWDSEEELNTILNSIKDIYLKMWENIEEKWPNLFSDKNEINNIIQATIGVSALNKYIILQLKNKNEEINIDTFNKNVKKWIMGIKKLESDWYSGNEFSKFSSESGFNMVANILYDSYID